MISENASLDVRFALLLMKFEVLGDILIQMHLPSLTSVAQGPLRCHIAEIARGLSLEVQVTIELSIRTSCAERNDNVVLPFALSQRLGPCVHMRGILFDHVVQIAHGLLLERVQIAVVDQVALVLKLVPEVLIGLVLDDGPLFKSFLKHLSHSSLLWHPRNR